MNKVIYSCLLFCALCLVLMTGIAAKFLEQQEQLDMLQHDVVVLSKVVQDHNDVMATYQFFNEHWDALMRGETHGN